VTARGSRRSRVTGSLLALGLGLLLAAASVAALEGACYLLNRARPGSLAQKGSAGPEKEHALLSRGAFEFPSRATERMVHDPVWVRIDPSEVVPVDHQRFMDRSSAVLATKPNFRGPSVLRARDGSTVYSTFVTTDEHGLRATPDRFAGRAKPRHLATIGCSFTWGVGVNDDETLASRLAERLADSHLYNFGLPGAGPNDLLAREQQLGVFSSIREPRGSAIYLLIGDHVQRAIGAMSVVGRWGMGDAYEEETSQGEFRLRGSWVRSMPIRTWLFGVLADRETTRFFQLDWPRADGAAVARTVRMIGALRRSYRAKTSAGNEMIVVVYQIDPNLHAALRDALDAEALPYLDYSPIDWSRITGQPSYIALDGHPAPPTYRALADAVIEDLHLDGGSGSAVTSQN